MKYANCVPTHPIIPSEDSILHGNPIRDDTFFIFTIESSCRAKGAKTQPDSTFPDDRTVLWRVTAPVLYGGYPGVLKLLRGFRSFDMILCTVRYFEPFLMTISTCVLLTTTSGVVAEGHGTYICSRSSNISFICFALAFAIALSFLGCWRLVLICGVGCRRSRSGGIASSAASSTSLACFRAWPFIDSRSLSLLSGLPGRWRVVIIGFFFFYFFIVDSVFVFFWDSLCLLPTFLCIPAL